MDGLCPDRVSTSVLYIPTFPICVQKCLGTLFCLLRGGFWWVQPGLSFPFLNGWSRNDILVPEREFFNLPMSAVGSTLHRVNRVSKRGGGLGLWKWPLNTSESHNGPQESSVFLQRQNWRASTPKHRRLAGAEAARILMHKDSTLWKPSQNKEKIKCFKMWAQRKSKLTSNKRLIFFSHREVSATYSSWQGSVSKGNLTKLHKALAGWL